MGKDNATNHADSNSSSSNKTKSHNSAPRITGIGSKTLPPHLRFSHFPLVFQADKFSSFCNTHGEVQVLQQRVVSAGDDNGVVIEKELDIFTAIGFRVAAKEWTVSNPKKKVLALHGFMDNAASFDGIGPLLAEQNMDVIAIDLIGMGRSCHPPNYQALSPGDYTATLLDIVNTLQWEQCLLIGHSAGGVLAMTMAATFPERVEGWVSIDILGPLTADHSYFPYSLRLAAIKRVELAGRERKKQQKKKAQQQTAPDMILDNQDPVISYSSRGVDNYGDSDNDRSLKVVENDYNNNNNNDNGNTISIENNNNYNNYNNYSEYEKTIADTTRMEQKRIFSSVEELAAHIKSQYPYGISSHAALALASRHAKPVELNGMDYRSPLSMNNYPSLSKETRDHTSFKYKNHLRDQEPVLHSNRNQNQREKRPASPSNLSGQVVMGASPTTLLAPTSWYWEENVIHCLKQIQCPTLVLFGANGWPWNPDNVAKREKAIPSHLRTVMRLPFGHHSPHLDQPERVASIILQWMQKRQLIALGDDEPELSISNNDVDPPILSRL